MHEARSQATTFSDADLDLLHTLAAGYVSFGRYHKAAAILNLGLWIAPGNKKLRELLALVTFRQGDIARFLDISKPLLAPGSPASDALRRCYRLASQSQSVR